LLKNQLRTRIVRKKGGIINIEDVGQQLERKAKIQELGEYEDEDQELIRLTKSNIDSVKPGQDTEDSEWIDFSDKPNLTDFAFKDFGEYREDKTEEDDENPKESKTWNVVEKKEITVEDEKPKPLQKFVPSRMAGASRRSAPLDLNNQEAFPSFTHAEEIEKQEKIHAEERKKMDEKRRIENEERKKKQDEDKKHVSPQQQSSQNAPQPQRTPYDIKPVQHQTGNVAPNYIQTAADSEGSWRSTNKAPIQTDADSEGSWRLTNKAPIPIQTDADSENSWRTVMMKPKTADSSIAVGKSGSNVNADTANSWRSQKAKPVVESTPVITADNEKAGSEASQRQKYVPPHLRH